MTLFTRQTAGGRCPCGAPHAACGPPSDVTPVDTFEGVTAVGGPLKKYNYTSPAGHDTVLKLNEADAERHGLTDDDLVEGQEPAEKPAAKKRAASSNKARTGSATKADG